MNFAIWCLLVGLLLILVALSSTVLKRLPVSTAMLYVGVGVALSPLGVGALHLRLLTQPVLLERLAEIAVLVSLFVAGMKLSPSLRDRRWRLPVRLALLSMVVTVGAITAVAHWGLGLPLGAAVLLGAILSPTDPVLASDVQVHHAGDGDKLRFALTGEGGLNDGTAFPFVMLGLGLLGLHELGAGGWRWWAVDVAWAVGAGLAMGAALGVAVARLVLYLRKQHKEAVGLDDFIALGLIALSYGVAVSLHAYGFLAVFAAGVALRHVEQSQRPEEPAGSGAMKQAALVGGGADAIAVDPQHAPSFMAQAVLGFNEQIERIGEVVVVITIGALLWAVPWKHANGWFVAVLLLAIRPLSVWIGLAGAPISRAQKGLIGWFGIRGIGSLYYLMYAINHGLPRTLAEQLVALTLSVVLASILFHGVSVTPLMAMYEKTVKKRRKR